MKMYKKSVLILFVLLMTHQMMPMFSHRDSHVSTHKIVRAVSHTSNVHSHKSLNVLCAGCGIIFGILIHAKESPDQARRELNMAVQKLHALPVVISNFKKRD